MIGIGVGIFILMKSDQNWNFIRFRFCAVFLFDFVRINKGFDPLQACVLVNWAIIRYLQQLKLKKKILKMAMMKARFEKKPCTLD